MSETARVPDSPLPADVAFAWADARSAGAVVPLPAEAALLSPRAVAGRVREFALGRSCAREALGRLEPGLGRAPILRASGSGSADRRPLWPEGFVGAITHKAGFAAAAAARAAAYRGLGLDLERVRAPSAALLRRILRPEERERFATLSEAQRDAAFTLVFSAKESLFKALNPQSGVYLGFQDAAIGLAPGAPALARGQLDWRLHGGCGPDYPPGSTGVGGFTRADGLVLTAVWVPASGGS
jgi:4'-phosphopantetheinyl transferase EntD